MRRLFLFAVLVSPTTGLIARGEDVDVTIPPVVIAGDPPLLFDEPPEVVQDPGAACLEKSFLGLGTIDAVPVDLPEMDAPAAAGRPRGFAPSTEREYVTFDVLFLERDNAVINQPIATEGPFSAGPGGVVLTTRSLVPATAPGVRLFVGRHGCDTVGWEFGYWGCYGFFGDARVDLPGRVPGRGGLAVPGGLSGTVPGWNDARTIRAGWSSSLNVAELNLLGTDIARICEPCSPWPTRRCASETETDLIGGLFWAGLEEAEALQVGTTEGAPTSYRVATSSNLFGGQLGVRRRRTWDRFALEGWLKAGLGGAWLTQSAAPITSGLEPGVAYRPGREAEDTGMGFLSSMNLSLGYRFSDAWGLRIGYNLAWLSGVALAANQFDFDATPAAGTGVRGAGGVFLHGANVGLEGRW